MSTLKTINLVHPSSSNTNIVLDANGNANVFGTLNATAMLVTGNVGIKTATPVASLDVNGAIVIANTLEPIYGYQGVGLLLTNQQSLAVNNTASAQYYVGGYFAPRVAGSNTGLTYTVGTYNVPYIDSSNQSGRLIMSGQEIYAYRSSANDISTFATNGIWGLYIEAGHQSGLNANASTSTVYGAQLVPENYRANVTSMYGVAVTGYSGTVVGANTNTTNFYSLYTNLNVGAASGVGNDRVTNYYDAYLNGATVAARGTLTNKYGVYQVKADHNNYFAGNVGINIIAPTSNLHVVGNANVSTNLRVGGNVSFDNIDSVRITEPAANTLTIHTASTERVRVDSTGNVAIGTSTASYRLGVQQSVNTFADIININNPLGGTGAWSRMGFLANNNLKYAYTALTDSGDFYFFNTSTGGNNVFGTNNNERMRIDSTGNVGIGTASPTYKLDVTGTGHITGVVTLDTALSVASGGTGVNTLTGIVKGSGTSAFSAAVRGTDYSLLSANSAVSSTSGQVIDFLNIPAGVKVITVMLNAVSSNGTSNLLVQIGDSGGIENSGYAGASTNFTNGTLGMQNFGGAGFTVFDITAATAVHHGHFTLTNISGNIWVCSGIISRSDTTRATVLSGTKTLSGTLDRVRVTTNTGFDVFDAGSINIFYEY